MKTQEIPKAKKYVYSINGKNPLTEGMILSFREDDRQSADIYATKEALMFGKDAKAIFRKEI